jgi:hypothetical protein
VQSLRAGVTDVLRPIVAISLLVVIAGCGVTTSLTPSTSTPTSATSGSPDSSTPGVSPSGSGSPSPTATASPTSPPPSATATVQVSASPSPTGPDSAAGACFGSASTRDFFTAIAEAVDWPVYCAVLPSGWAVDRGSGNTYALANGGRMVIGYHNNAGAHLELREGHWCTDSASACAPHDQDIGPIALGDLQGELMSLGPDAGFAVYVDPGQVPSWAVTGTGMDEATLRSLCGALAIVGA